MTAFLFGWARQTISEETVPPLATGHRGAAAAAGRHVLDAGRQQHGHRLCDGLAPKRAAGTLQPLQRCACLNLAVPDSAPLSLSGRSAANPLRGATPHLQRRYRPCRCTGKQNVPADSWHDLSGRKQQVRK